MHYQTITVLLAASAAVVSALPASEPNTLVARAAKLAPYCTPTGTTPAGSVCGKAGKVKNAKVLLSTGSIYHEQTCRNACAGNAKCKSYGFTSGLNEHCTLYSASVKSMGFTAQAGSDTVYSDRNCSTCKACKASYKNGGFESGTIAPWTADGTTGYSATVVSPGEGGSNGQVSLTAPPNSPFSSDFGVTLGQNIRLCVGANYTASFDYTVTSGSSVALDFAIDQEFINIQNFPAPGTYATSSTTFQCTDQDDTFMSFGIVNFNSGSSSTVLIDNVKIVKV